ncbi:MAG: Rv3235 family protein [Candidatus Nanopelagicales bacterium]
MVTKHQSDTKRVRPLLRCVQVSQLNETVVNASAVIQKGLRGRAMAMRLVAESDRWRCTELLVA